MSDEILRAYVCVDCGFNEGESPQAGCCRRCGSTSHECDIVDFVSLSKVRERLANPEFLRAVKEKLPPGVRPSTIDLSMALHMALAAAFPAEPGEEEGT